MVTFRLTTDQFQRLLTVVMADDVSDHLSNAVLMACTRAHAGIISVPLPRRDGDALLQVVERAMVSTSSIADVADALRAQFGAAS